MKGIWQQLRTTIRVQVSNRLCDDCSTSVRHQLWLEFQPQIGSQVDVIKNQITGELNNRRGIHGSWSIT